MLNNGFNFRFSWPRKTSLHEIGIISWFRKTRYFKYIFVVSKNWFVYLLIMFLVLVIELSRLVFYGSALNWRSADCHCSWQQSNAQHKPRGQKCAAHQAICICISVNFNRNSWIFRFAQISRIFQNHWHGSNLCMIWPFLFSLNEQSSALFLILQERDVNKCWLTVRPCN